MKPGRMQRQEKVEKIKQYLDNSDSFVISDYRGLTVEQISEIRRELMKHEAEMHVHKNRFIKIALKDKEYPQEVIEQMTGPNAVVYVQGDISEVLKTLFGYVKKEYPIEVRGSYVDTGFLDKQQSETLSNLPSKEVMLAMVMGTMQAPVRNFASGLQEVIASFARAVQAVADSKK